MMDELTCTVIGDSHLFSGTGTHTGTGTKS